MGAHARASVILTRRRRALESESHIKKKKGGGGEGEYAGGGDVSTLTANIEQTAHYSTMPKLFTRLDGAWPSHGNVQTRRELNEHFIGGAPFTEGQNSRRGRGENHKSPAIEQVGAASECGGGGTDRWSKAAAAVLGCGWS